jgi:hypothetical protein
MLSTQYRLRLEGICRKIALQEEVSLDDIIWAEKLAKSHTTARDWLNKARRKAANPDMVEGSMDDFMNKMGLGDPDPSNYLILIHQTIALDFKVLMKLSIGLSKINQMIGVREIRLYNTEVRKRCHENLSRYCRHWSNRKTL